MSNFCPEWVYALCCAKTASDFLSSNSPLSAIAKKFSNKLSEHYDEIKFEEIVDTAEKILQFLSEINASEEAVNMLNDFIYVRSSLNSNGSPRKIQSVFSSEFNSTKLKEYGQDKTNKVFKASIFSIRNDVLPKAPPGWTINDVPDIDWLGQVFEEEVDNFSL